jgi:hypothetical protein
MFENLGLFCLEDAEQALAQFLNPGMLVGHIDISPDDYDRLMQTTCAFLASNKTRLHKVPLRVWLVGMAFCARYEEHICHEGFWTPFLRTVGLSNNSTTQEECGQKWKSACHQFGLPIEDHRGPYRYVREVLRHAVLPQTCVPPLARLLATVRDEWNSMSSLPDDELADFLLESSDATLKRFLQRQEFQPEAVRLIQELCALTEEWQQGRLTSDDVSVLAADDPILKQIWRELQEELAKPRQTSTSLKDVFAELCWRWDVDAQQLGLFVPRQRLRRRASSYQIGSQHFLAFAVPNGTRWMVSETWIPYLRIGQEAEHLTVQLLDEDGAEIHHWQVVKPSGSVLFFRPDASGKFGTWTPHHNGIECGAWLIAYQRGVELTGRGAPLNPYASCFAPMPFDNYEAGFFWVNADVTVNDVEIIRVTESTSRRLRFEGGQPLKMNGQSVAPVYERAPDLIVSANSREEVAALRLWLKPLETTQMPRTLTPRVADLLDEGKAIWDDAKCELLVSLLDVLPSHIAGHFEVSLRRGWQHTRYSTEEFSLVPGLRVEMEDRLWTMQQPPTAMLIAPETSDVQTEAQLQREGSDQFRLRWKGTDTDFTCTLVFSDFRLPLTFSPHILRARVGNQWLENPLEVNRSDLTFDRTLQVEGKPHAPYMLNVNGQAWKPGEFPASGCLDKWKLADFDDLVYARAEKRIEVMMSVMEQELPLLVIYNAPVIENLTLNLVGKQLHVKGKPLGQRDEHYKFVLHSRYFPWREPMPLSDITPDELERGTSWELRETWQVGVYDVEVFLVADGQSTPVLNKQGQAVQVQCGQSPSPAALRVACCAELLALPSEEARQWMQEMFDAGVNFAAMSANELQAALRQSNQNTTALWEMWQPLGSFEEAPRLHTSGFSKHWRECIGIGPSALSRGMRLRLFDEVNEFRMVIKDIDVISGEVVAEEDDILRENLFSQAVTVRWKATPGRPQAVVAWIEVEGGREKRFAYLCPCGRARLDVRPEKYCPCMHEPSYRGVGGKLQPNLPLITEEQPLRLQVQVLNEPIYPDYTSEDIKRLILKDVGERVEPNWKRIEPLKDKRLPFFDPACHLRAFVKCWEEFRKDYPNPARQAMFRLATMEDWQRWRQVMAELFAPSCLPSRLAGRGIDLLWEPLNLYKTWHNEISSVTPLSRLNYVVWTIAILNRLAARDPRAALRALQKGGFEMEKLTKTSADAFRGCRLLFEWALCQVEAILACFETK